MQLKGKCTKVFRLGFLLGVKEDVLKTSYPAEYAISDMRTSGLNDTVYKFNELPCSNYIRVVCKTRQLLFRDCDVYKTRGFDFVKMIINTSLQEDDYRILSERVDILGSLKNDGVLNTINLLTKEIELYLGKALEELGLKEGFDYYIPLFWFPVLTDVNYLSYKNSLKSLKDYPLGVVLMYKPFKRKVIKRLFISDSALKTHLKELDSIEFKGFLGEAINVKDKLHMYVDCDNIPFFKYMNYLSTLYTEGQKVKITLFKDEKTSPIWSLLHSEDFVEVHSIVVGRMLERKSLVDLVMVHEISKDVYTKGVNNIAVVSSDSDFSHLLKVVKGDKKCLCYANQDISHVYLKEMRTCKDVDVLCLDCYEYTPEQSEKYIDASLDLLITKYIRSEDITYSFKVEDFVKTIHTVLVGEGLKVHRQDLLEKVLNKEYRFKLNNDGLCFSLDRI